MRARVDRGIVCPRVWSRFVGPPARTAPSPSEEQTIDLTCRISRLVHAASSYISFQLSSLRLLAQLLQPTVVEQHLHGPVNVVPLGYLVPESRNLRKGISRSHTVAHAYRVCQYRKAGSATAIHFVGPPSRPCRPLVQFPLQAGRVERTPTHTPADPAARERVFHFLVASGWIIQCFFHRQR